MRQGTTPKHTFTLPFDVSEVKLFSVVYAQDLKTVLCKKEGIAESNVITVFLTQEETFQFNHKKLMQIQLRVLKTDGEAVASRVFTESVQPCLSNEVLA